MCVLHLLCYTHLVSQEEPQTGRTSTVPNTVTANEVAWVVLYFAAHPEVWASYQDPEVSDRLVFENMLPMFNDPSFKDISLPLAGSWGTLDPNIRYPRTGTKLLVYFFSFLWCLHLFRLYFYMFFYIFSLLSCFFLGRRGTSRTSPSLGQRCRSTRAALATPCPSTSSRARGSSKNPPFIFSHLSFLFP